MNSKISCAVASILGTVSASGLSVAWAQTNEAASQPAAEVLEEVTVTAQRRTETMQNVPIAMQAFTAQTLQQLNVVTLDDYLKYLPSVTTANNGPGQNEVFMRGLSAGAQPSQGSGSTGLWPNVAIYLDNQSVQLPNRNLDVYAADLNRIEVLEGPQGTLYGAGAEAGVIRYITNLPKLDVVEGSVKGGYGVTAHGDPNTDVQAVLNLPLIPGALALRGVIYDDRRGGYIDNVPATFTRRTTDVGIHYANFPATGAVCPDGEAPSPQPHPGFCVPPNSPVINNAGTTARAINPVTYEGVRLEALYKFNEDWDLLVTQSYQDMDSRGVFYQQPNASDGAPLAPLEVTLFNTAFDKDRFENTAWTLNGRLGNLKAVYTGGYLVRNVEQVGDYTNYARGVYSDYYQCFGPGSGYDASLTATCYSPSSMWHSVERNLHQQHELRLSTPDDWRLRAIAGAFWEDNKLYDQTDWRYRTVPSCTTNAPPGTPGNGDTGCFSDIGTFPGTTVQNPGVQTPNSSFYQDTVRDTKQTAFFASFDFDLVPKVLTVTAGTRHFRFQNYSKGSVISSFGCFEKGVQPGGCHSGFYSYNLDADNLQDTESGWKSRANLTWHVTPDAMVYYTFSQGFRPGGFNQNHYYALTDPKTGQLLVKYYAYGPDAVQQYAVPAAYQSDKLTNNEVGWKTEFWDHRLQWNGAWYQENWDNAQVAFFNPGLTGNIFFNTNGQNFLIKGIETSFAARPVAGLTVQGAATWNYHREQTNSPQLLVNNPASVNFGKPITEFCDLTGHNCNPFSNPFGATGFPPANTPPLEFSLRARYEWALPSGYTAHVQAGATHNAHSFTQAGQNPSLAQAGLTTGRLRFENPAYSTYSASIGVAKDAWYFDLVGENLSNSNSSVFISTQQFIVAQTPLRPRVITANVGYSF